MKYRGTLIEWAATHGLIATDEGRRVYVCGTEMPRSFVPKLGTRLTFEIVEDAPPGESQLPSARNVVLVVK